MRHEAFAATSFVFVARPHLDPCLGFDGTLRVISRTAAFYAYRMRFCNEFGNRKQLRHRLEGFSGIVLIEAGHYHTLAAVSKLVYGIDQLHIEKLALVDTYYLRIFINQLHHLGGRRNRPREMRLS